MNRTIYIKIIFTIMCFFTSLESFSQDDELSFSKIELDTSKNWSWHLENSTSVALSEQDIVLLDSLLKSRITAYNSSDKPLLLGGKIDFTKYKYQFVGGLNKQGEKEVWVNAFCNDYDTSVNWHDEIVEVNDGGNCFFNLKINLTLNLTSDFYVNGY